MTSGSGTPPDKPGFGAADAFAFLRGPHAPVIAGLPKAAPPTPHLNDSAIANAAKFKAADALRAGRSVASVNAAAAAAGQVADRAWDEISPAIEARRQPGFACAAGCAWCCHQQVSLTPAEAIAISAHVRATFSPDDLSALKARLDTLDDRSRGLGVWARAKLKTACAFLVDNRCSIYAVRPLRCRGVISRDADHCRHVMEHPDDVFADRQRQTGPGPYPVEPARIMDAALTGLARASQEMGLGWDALELTAALRIALETPDIAERFVAGEPVFAAAHLPARDDATQ